MTLKDNIDLIKAFKVLKCLKCGNYSNTTPLALRNIFSIKKLKRKNRKCNYKLSSLFIPVCKRCGLEFQTWKRFQTNFMKSCLKSFAFMGFISLIIWHIYNNLWEISIIISFFGVIVAVYDIKGYNKLKNMEFYPKKYLRFDKKGNFYVKPEKSSTWKEYMDWLKDTIYEVEYRSGFHRSLKIEKNKKKNINCIYCGVKVKKNDIKCYNCGKFLPLI